MKYHLKQSISDGETNNEIVEVKNMEDTMREYNKL